MFGCGILLHETVRRRSRCSHIGNAMAIVAFGCALFANGWKDYITFRSGHTVVDIPLALMLVGTYVLMYFALAEQGLVSQWLQWEWLRWFGNISYSYYLVHGLVLQILKVALESLGLPRYLSPVLFMMLGVFAFMATVLSSAGIFLAIEKPLSFSRMSRTPDMPARGRNAKMSCA
jgi:peptidoglycan/LPS O-acetylase OafA/YrhL